MRLYSRRTEVHYHGCGSQRVAPPEVLSAGEILELVLSGCTNQEISNSMGLSLGTVKNYVSSLLLALDVKSRSHMVSLFR